MYELRLSQGIPMESALLSLYLDGTYQLRYSEYTMDLICSLSLTDNKYIDRSPHIDEDIEQRFYITVNKITRRT